MSARVARTAVREVLRVDAGGGSRVSADRVVVEEPLEIRLGDEPVVVTMRTPGDDEDLAVGFLFSEGVLPGMDRVASVGHGPVTDADAGNIVSVVPAAGSGLSAEGARRILRASAACGLCGKATLAAVRARVPPIDDPTTVPLAVVAGLGDALRAAQPVFRATGGLHAAGLFRPDGALVLVREDVGRHNAVDKLVGAVLRRGGRDLSGHVVMFSGRAGMEIVQKAAVARAPVVCAVSAPSSLAVDIAREVGLTLAGFVRGGSVNLYAHPWRVRAGTSFSGS